MYRKQCYIKDDVITVITASCEKNLKMPKTFLDSLRTNSGAVKTLIFHPAKCKMGSYTI
jgi:hypothetical protein